MFVIKQYKVIHGTQKHPQDRNIFDTSWIIRKKYDFYMNYDVNA